MTDCGRRRAPDLQRPPSLSCVTFVTFVTRRFEDNLVVNLQVKRYVASPAPLGERRGPTFLLPIGRTSEYN
jgi:hypothetical protein